MAETPFEVWQGRQYMALGALKALCKNILDDDFSMSRRVAKERYASILLDLAEADAEYDQAKGESNANRG